jgi:two-component system OmpR family response regulator
MHVLLIEDDADVMNLIVDALEEAGHTVEHGENGRSGLFAAGATKFDIIILDRNLPGGIDGLRILETLRSEGDTTPILILSGLSDVKDRLVGLRAGASDYLSKPFAVAELLARVDVLTRPRK